MTSSPSMKNVEPETVEGFGAQWDEFDNTGFSEEELLPRFNVYFHIFPWDALPKDAVGVDAGCGTGRWARCVAPRVGKLICVDAAASAVDAARRGLAGQTNVEFHVASIAELPVPDASLDFGYSLGVLHYVPDPVEGLKSIARKLKPGAPFLLYVYYALENRPQWYRNLWRAVDVSRTAFSYLPFAVKRPLTQAIAATVYWPLARGALLAEALGADVKNVPLAAYRDKPFYVMRTDALDRFAPRIEHRFTRQQVEDMMKAAGFVDIRFSEKVPFWVAVGRKGPGG